MAEPHIDGEIQNGRHAMAVRVYYEDTDFPGSIRVLTVAVASA
jgi:acyl-CoA thioester hydrolase